MNIQWYPGHMAKTRRQIENDLKLCDAVIELCDARIAASSRNPDLAELCGAKPRLVVFGRADLADPIITEKWIAHVPGSVAINAVSNSVGKIVIPAISSLLADKLRKYEERGQSGRALKLMVVGIPNVGKSTLINSLLGRKSAKAEDRPGVTRGKSWFVLSSGDLLMDTPGMLWPKFEDETVGLHIAFTGAVRDEILDAETLAIKLFETLGELYPERLAERYGLDVEKARLEAEQESEGFVPPLGGILLEAAAKRRGYLISGGESDTLRMARTFLDEFRAGKLGKVSLEKP